MPRISPWRALALAPWRKRLWRSNADRLGLAWDPLNRRLFRSTGARLTQVDLRGTIEVICGPVPSDIALLPERSCAIPGQVDVWIGEERFDETVWTLGNEARLLAALDRRTRARVVDGVQHWGLRVECGAVRLLSPPVRHEADLLMTLHRVEAIASALALSDAEVPRGLVERAETETASMVRVRALEALLDLDPALPEVRHGARIALGLAELDTQLLAARILGDEAAAHLRALVRDTNVPPRFQYRAMRRLVEHHPGLETEDLVVECLSTLDYPLRQAAIICAGHGRVKAATASLLTLLEADLALGEHGPDAVWETSVHACEALARCCTGDIDPEPSLWRALQCPSDAVRGAAADALAELGTLRSVQPLLSVTTVRNRAPQQRARRAIQVIQQRFGGPGRGTLAVCGTGPQPFGRISPAPETGQLTSIV